MTSSSASPRSSGRAALIVVIGPDWATAADPDGRPRLQDPADFVRREVGAAVHRSDVTVIPVLVANARMPRADQLPEEVEPLTRRQALELSDGRWRYDVGRLIAQLEELLAGLTGFIDATQPEAPSPEQPRPEAADEVAPPPRPRSLRDGARITLEGALVAAVTAFLARTLADEVPRIQGTILDALPTPVVRQTIVWALVAAGLALWLGARSGRTEPGRLACLALLGLLLGAGAGFLGSMIWGISVESGLPKNWSQAAKEDAEGWAVANFAVTGAALGALLGFLWRPPRLAIGLLSGLLAGARSDRAQRRRLESSRVAGGRARVRRPRRRDRRGDACRPPRPGPSRRAQALKFSAARAGGSR